MISVILKKIRTTPLSGCNNFFSEIVNIKYGSEEGLPVFEIKSSKHTKPPIRMLIKMKILIFPKIKKAFSHNILLQIPNIVVIW